MFNVAGKKFFYVKNFLKCVFIPHSCRFLCKSMVLKRCDVSFFLCNLFWPMFCHFIHRQHWHFYFLSTAFHWFLAFAMSLWWSPDVQIKAKASFYGNIALTNYSEMDVWAGDLMTCLNAGLLSSHCHRAVHRLSSGESNIFLLDRAFWIWNVQWLH